MALLLRMYKIDWRVGLEWIRGLQPKRNVTRCPMDAGDGRLPKSSQESNCDLKLYLRVGKDALIHRCWWCWGKAVVVVVQVKEMPYPKLSELLPKSSPE